MMAFTQVNALSKQIWYQVLEDSVSVDKMNRVGSGFLTPLEWNGMEEGVFLHPEHMLWGIRAPVARFLLSKAVYLHTPNCALHTLSCADGSQGRPTSGY